MGNLYNDKLYENELNWLSNKNELLLNSCLGKWVANNNEQNNNWADSGKNGRKEKFVENCKWEDETGLWNKGGDTQD